MSYTPSRFELRTFRRLLAKLTPGSSTYREYHECAERYLAAHDLVLPAVSYGRQLGAVTRLQMHKSELFGPEYLVAYVDSEWLRGVAPESDAIASTMLGPDLNSAPPPLVLVPEARVRSRSESFRSVLEHEFVHINQALLGVFPYESAGRRSKNLVADFLAYTRAEYEANLLQLTQWPRLYPRKCPLSLDHWCVLRGYSQALEKTLMSAAERNLSSDEVSRFLDTLPKGLLFGFKRIGVHKHLAPWFQKRWNQHVYVAIGHIFNALPEIKDNNAFRSAARWLKTRLGVKTLSAPSSTISRR
jgi:hypothetical protein